MLKYFVLVLAVTAPTSAFLGLENVYEPVVNFFGFGQKADIMTPAVTKPASVVNSKMSAPAPEIFAGTVPAVEAPEKGNCPIVKHASPHFENKVPEVHTAFVPALERIIKYAEESAVKLYITSSFRKNTDVHGAIVPPAVKSNHMVGRAIDMNIVSKSGFCNSECLAGHLTGDVAKFIGKVRADHGLRWGGDFTPRDTVHIDDGLNLRDPAEWDREYIQAQKYC